MISFETSIVGKFMKNRKSQVSTFLIEKNDQNSIQKKGPNNTFYSQQTKKIDDSSLQGIKSKSINFTFVFKKKRLFFRRLRKS